MNTLGTTLRRLRDQRGLTRKQLEEKTGIPDYWIRDLENGNLDQRAPEQRLEKIRTLAAALGYSFAGFLREAGMIEPDSESFGGDPGLRELVANLSVLTPEERQMVEDLIRTIVRGKTTKRE
jgi:transcriptional regulator with XRE-family HTH domain